MKGRDDSPSETSKARPGVSVALLMELLITTRHEELNSRHKQFVNECSPSWHDYYLQYQGPRFFHSSGISKARHELFDS
jgi:hypothetical protein